MDFNTNLDLFPSACEATSLASSVFWPAAFSTRGLDSAIGIWGRGIGSVGRLAIVLRQIVDMRLRRRVHNRARISRKMGGRE